MPSLPVVKLQKNREFGPLRGHPWVYRDAVVGADALPPTGTLVRVTTHKHWDLGPALVDRESPIALRCFGADAEPDLDVLLRARLARALQLRTILFPDPTVTDSFRLCFGEGDGLPALVVDRYHEGLVIQIHSPAWAPHLPAVVDTLQTLVPEANWILSRGQRKRPPQGPGAKHPDHPPASEQTAPAGSDADAIDLRQWRGAPPPRVTIIENGLRFSVDVRLGQKTGFFFDQRDNRLMLRGLARNRRVLNVCAYTGGFTVAALAGGARQAVSIDLAGPALAEAAVNCRQNGFAIPAADFVRADMREYLATLDPGRFDAIVLDPPAMAHARSQVDRARHTYETLNREAIARIDTDGIIFTASCSAQIGRDDFLALVENAARRAGRPVMLLAETHHPADHPIPAGFPEGRYLHGLFLRVGGRPHTPDTDPRRAPSATGRGDARAPAPTGGQRARPKAANHPSTAAEPRPRRTGPAGLPRSRSAPLGLARSRPPRDPR